MSRGSFDRPRQVWGVGDLSAALVQDLLVRAAELSKGRPAIGERFDAGLLFLQPSLRTRLGFAAAVSRLGGTHHIVAEAKFTAEMSSAESLEDMLRICSGYCDLVVLRYNGSPSDALRAAVAGRGFINGGDGDGNHPSQALIDLFAIQQFAGPVEKIRIGICGDLNSRAARSLIAMFAELPPVTVRLIAPDVRMGPPVTGANVEWASPQDVSGLDVLYLAGLAPGQGPMFVDQPERSRFAFGENMAARLPRSAVVLSPMPVIDEIAPAQRLDPRVKMQEQSAMGLFVRMALVEWVLGWNRGA